MHDQRLAYLWQTPLLQRRFQARIYSTMLGNCAAIASNLPNTIRAYRPVSITKSSMSHNRGHSYFLEVRSLLYRYRSRADVELVVFRSEVAPWKTPLITLRRGDNTFSFAFSEENERTVRPLPLGRHR